MKGPNGEEERRQENRFKQCLDAGIKPPLPEIKAGEHLVEAMLALGPTRAMDKGGLRPTDWPEIWPFMQATGAIVEPWEAETLHKMCAAYLAGYRAGESPFGIAPMERN